MGVTIRVRLRSGLGYDQGEGTIRVRLRLCYSRECDQDHTPLLNCTCTTFGKFDIVVYDLDTLRLMKDYRAQIGGALYLAGFGGLQIQLLPQQRNYRLT